MEFSGEGVVLGDPTYVLPDYVPYVRTKLDEPFVLRGFGPRSEQAGALGLICPACRNPLDRGEYTTLVPVGPGDDEDQQRRCHEGRWYNAVAVEAHLECVVGRCV